MSICPCDRIVTPELVIPAGLNALPRQIRAFPEIRRALLAAIPQKPALREWRARNSQDLGLMLIDMWAYVSDVLAFYDERIANEEYIRTAVRRPSLRRLVELLGFVPSPGQAATVALAALAEGRSLVNLAAGTGFRSDAFGTEPPQVFEVSQDATIHPLKNEWTIGPQQTADVSQATPSEAAGAGGTTSGPRSFQVFDTNGFGLVRDRLALVQVGTGSPAATRVQAVTPFGGKDGKTYVEAEFAPPVDVGGAAPEDVKVLVPTVTAVVTHNDLGTGIPNIKISEDNVLEVFLDTIYRQIHTGDQVIVTGATEAPQVSPVSLVTEPLATIPGTNPPLKIPVTKISLDPSPIPTLSGLDTSAISFHFTFVRGGTVTTVAKTELSQPDFNAPGASISGIVQPPPDATPENGAFLVGPRFLLADVDKKGVDLKGTLRIDSAGRATLSAADGSAFTDILKTPITAFGNVIEATRGETVNGEVLGNGDPTLAGQKFKLKKKPLTYIPATNDVGRTSTLRISVDGVQWREVKSFFNCGPQSQVYTVRFDDDLNAIITFGDGVTGARLSAGVGNVVATYRFGSGAAAPPAGAIQQIARSVIGLRAVRSPIKALPGKDADTAEQIRKIAPRTALLFSRLVSTDDFLGYASFYAGVVKASAEFEWKADLQQPAVNVTVIGDVDKDQLRKALIGLAEESLIVSVTVAVAIPMSLILNVEVDPRFDSGDVLAAVTAALIDPETGPLAPAQASIGGQFLASPLFETAQGVPGVVSVESASVSIVGETFLIESLGLDFSKVNLDTNLGKDHVVCVPAGGYFDFVGPDASITPGVAKAQGPASASTDKGC